MKFTLGKSKKIPITINDVEHMCPKFLGDAFDEHTERFEAKRWEDALSEYKPEEREARARLRVMYQFIPPDVNLVIADLKTSKGCDTVIRWCLQHATPPVPAELIADLLAEEPVQFKRQLTGVLLGTEQFADAMAKDSGEPEDQPGDGASPLTSSGGESGQ